MNDFRDVPQAHRAVLLTVFAVAAGLPAAAQTGGVSYAPPPGWTRQDLPDSTIYAGVLRPEPRASHQARLFVFKPTAAPQGMAARFEAEWRAQFGSLGVGDTVAHYRGRLPGGINAHFMGRSFERPGQGDFYTVMYLLDLGDRAQVIAASVVPGWEGVGYPAAIEASAHQALSQALFPLLDSLRLPGRTASGPLFTRAEVQGDWTYRDGGDGGSFSSAQSGALLGAAVRGASSDLKLRADGTYSYGFAFYAVNPAGGNLPPQAENHDGRYEFNDDILTWRPRQKVSYDPRRRVVGTGVQRTAKGPRRLLILTSPGEGTFRQVPWVPQWSRYDGIMHWYVEEPPR